MTIVGEKPTVRWRNLRGLRYWCVPRMPPARVDELEIRHYRVKHSRRRDWRGVAAYDPVENVLYVDGEEIWSNEREVLERALLECVLETETTLARLSLTAPGN